MRKLNLLLVSSVVSLSALGITLTIEHPGGADYVSAAWQGANTTVSAAFGTNVPSGTQVLTWNVTNQNWNSSYFDDLDGAWLPNLTLNNTDGFLLRSPTATTFYLSGADLTVTNVNKSFGSNLWYFVGFAFPRAGWLEKPPYPYSPSANLNFPGSTNCPTCVSDEYSRWDTSTQTFYWTRRLNESHNTNGGYFTTNYGARWYVPGSTNTIQGNGYANQWIEVGEPIFWKPFTSRTWGMYDKNAWE
jgi:hypothetical protein